MKKILVLAAALALVSSTAFAGNSANLAVTANVTATCTIVGGTLGFGALDPSNPVIKTAVSSGVTVACTTGTTAAVTDNAVLNPLILGASSIPFSLAHPAAVAGDGTAQVYAITGTIAAGSYATALAGAYTSNVTLTVTP